MLLVLIESYDYFFSTFLWWRHGGSMNIYFMSIRAVAREIEFANAISASTGDCPSVQICWGMLQLLQEIENITNIVSET